MLVFLAATALQTAPATVACPGGLHASPAAPCPTLIFFDSSEANINRDAARALDEVVASWKTGGFSHVLLEGHSDLSGPTGANLRVARQRAEAVKDWLAERGVPAAAITVRSHGETRPFIPTADGVREPQNRRVAVRLER